MKTWKVNFAVLLCAALMSLSAGADAGTRRQTTDSAAVSTFVWPRLRIGVDFGGGYGLGKTDPDLDPELISHANRLRWGAVVGADVSWFFMKSLGAGIKGKLMYSSSSVDMGTASYPVTLTENISIPFVGPMICSRSYSRDGKHCLTANFAAGYCGYYDNFNLIERGKLKADTAGMCWDLGYDVRLSPDISFGIQLSYLYALLDKNDITVEHSLLTKEAIAEYMGDDLRSCSHIDLTVGLRFNFGCRGKK